MSFIIKNPKDTISVNGRIIKENNKTKVFYIYLVIRDLDIYDYFLEVYEMKSLIINYYVNLKNHIKEWVFRIKVKLKPNEEFDFFDEIVIKRNITGPSGSVISKFKQTITLRTFYVFQERIFEKSIEFNFR